MTNEELIHKLNSLTEEDFCQFDELVQKDAADRRYHRKIRSDHPSVGAADSFMMGRLGITVERWLQLNEWLGSNIRGVVS